MITEIPRDEFILDFWNWRPGEHVLVISPTGGGKTHLLWQLLEESMTQFPEITPRVYMPKPSDQTTDDWAMKLGLKETPVWPPRKKFFEQTPRGYVVWPPHAQNLDPEQRRELVGRELRKGLDAGFKQGNSINLIDDAHSSAALFHLNSYVEEVLVNGRANHASAWLGTQKPSGTLVSGGLSTFAYSSASHLFLGRDRDENNRKRFAEIGGVDPKLVERIVSNLRTYRVGNQNITEWLYIGPGPCMALVGP